MKKVLALLLAAAMATTMAFAAPDLTTGLADSGNIPAGADDQLFPGESYDLSFTAGHASEAPDVVRSASVKWTKGGAMVETLKVKKNADDWNYLELNLKENYTIDEPKELVGEVTVRYKDDHENETYEIALTVGNDLETVYTERRADDAEDIELADNTIYEADGTGYIKTSSGDDLLQATIRMKDGEQAFLYMVEDGDALDTVLDEYETADDLYVNTYDFVAHPDVANATVTLQADYKDQYYIYELNGTKLEEVKTSWNREDGQYEWDTTVLGTYVISEDELIPAEDDTTTEEENKDTTVEENPSTGANDFVGLAVALAVVSVAGIAVAKRK